MRKESAKESIKYLRNTVAGEDIETFSFEKSITNRYSNPICSLQEISLLPPKLLATPSSKMVSGW